MKHIFFVVIFLFLGVFFTSAQPPKRELRAAWIATVANIDWPTKQGLPAIEQQQQFVQRLDKLKQLGCNAVIVQVRPCCDACYPSTFEPWSRYLTGRQGEAPFPYYDPLLFMIEEVHKRNMEFHAWFNPFRALMDCRVNPNPPKHVTRSHTNWIINYGGKSYLDPGVPEAREYVINIIKDVVERYDIDAVHLDDYFYPYRIGKTPFGDAKSYAKYGNGENKDNWRRNNVNLFISQLHSTIKQLKPYVKIGISPFGVWRNINRDPAEGSETTAGQTCYDDLYADVLLWLKRGWVDYLMPQLYWEHGNRAASFTVLLDWWNKHSYKKQIYYGLGVYHLSEHNNHYSVNELLWQIKDIRKSSINSGYSFYSAVSFDKIGPALSDSLQQNYVQFIAIPPAMKWIDSIPPTAPILKSTTDNKKNILKWTLDNPQSEPIKYVVYRFPNKEVINLERADRIMALLQEAEYKIPDEATSKHCTYIVTALDRLWNESKPSNKIVID